MVFVLIASLLSGSPMAPSSRVTCWCLKGHHRRWVLLRVIPFPVPIEPARLGPPVVSFYPFWGEGSPAKIDYRKKGALILTSKPGGPRS